MSEPGGPAAVVARSAAQAVLDMPVDTPVRLGAGRSCDAFLVRSTSGVERVVRVPVPGTDRSIRFHAEAALGSALRAAGHPVSSWTVVDVDGVDCVVGERLAGRPINYGVAWSSRFASQLGNLLADLHRLEATGYGPLVNSPGQLRGETESTRDGVCRRWRWATCWPFEQSSLSGHPIERVLPGLTSAIEPLEERLLNAIDGPAGIVHSDLHSEHLLVDEAGELSGVLDFGAAFVGAVAWDFALLHWYYGAQTSRRVATGHPNGRSVDEAGRLLAVAVGMYKLAKSPTSPEVAERLRRVVRTLE